MSKISSHHKTKEVRKVLQLLKEKEINAKSKVAVSLTIGRKMSQTRPQVKTPLNLKTILNRSINHIHHMSLRKELVVLDWGHIERKNRNPKYHLSSQLS